LSVVGLEVVGCWLSVCRKPSRLCGFARNGDFTEFSSTRNFPSPDLPAGRQVEAASSDGQKQGLCL